MSPDADQVLISYRDQQLLGILPADYPCYLGGSNEEEEEDAEDLSEEVRLDPESEDLEADVVYRIFGKILEKSGEEMIPKDYREQSLMEEMFRDKEELISQKSPLEQKMIRKYREVFAQSLNPGKFLSGEEMHIEIDKTKAKAKNC